MLHNLTKMFCLVTEKVNSFFTPFVVIFLDALFSWSRAVQIRTNLDLVLDWLQGAGLGDIASEFMKKLSATVNFLCTPKTRLIQVIHLHCPQVFRVLGQEYKVFSFIVVSSSSHPGAVYRRTMCC